MALIHSRPAALPDRPYSDDELSAAVRASNHDTSLASWTVAMMAVGVLVQVGLLASAEPSFAQLALTVLLIPLMAAGSRIVLLLDRASAALGAAANASQILAGLETRSMWTFQARLWSYGTAAAFCLWTVGVQFLAR
ncbi:hypothetical protein [Actinocorallia sp. A-T 12471]|uniref:hypothetical protein n=1 Tax=Actinocorallia sp. A-T 12471 TaxID=3089813 RepID=UPI0029D3F4C6|nr:hypothetical protein [Actinocorallia sp. A-T 12471]MDX6744262.1 hypothetical protein [Actinocorallia sp. A-T 12471]